MYYCIVLYFWYFSYCRLAGSSVIVCGGLSIFKYISLSLSLALFLPKCQEKISIVMYCSAIMWCDWLTDWLTDWLALWLFSLLITKSINYSRARYARKGRANCSLFTFLVKGNTVRDLFKILIAKQFSPDRGRREERNLWSKRTI